MITLRHPVTPYLVLAGAVLLAFGGGLGASFHFDDFALFSDPYITSPSGWFDVWRLEQTRPLTYFTFWLNYMPAGREAALWHAVNLAVHLGTVLLLFGTLKRIIPVRPAMVAAALFAVHPIQTEAVIYVFARATLLMTLFCVLSLRSWLRGRHWVAVLWFAVALLAKEECAAFPLFLLLLHFSVSRNRREFAPIGAMAALALAAGLRVIYVLAQSAHSGAGPGAAITAGDYFLTQPVVIFRYLRLLLVPYGFTVDPAIAAVPAWAGVLGWMVILAVALLCLRRFTGARAGFWALAGLVLLLPSSSIFPANDLAADRRMYLPLIGFAAAAGFLARRLDRRLLGVAVLALVAVSFARTEVWRSEATLWEEAVRRAPRKVRPKIQLARVSEPARAIALLEKAKRIAPDDARVASELGRRWLERGETRKALAELGRALALAPNDPLAYNSRGVALATLGQVHAAVRDFEHALRLDPCLFDPHLNLKRLGQPDAVPAGCRFTPEQERELDGDAGS